MHHVLMLISSRARMNASCTFRVLEDIGVCRKVSAELHTVSCHLQWYHNLTISLLDNLAILSWQ